MFLFPFSTTNEYKEALDVHLQCPPKLEKHPRYHQFRGHYRSGAISSASNRSLQTKDQIKQLELTLLDRTRDVLRLGSDVLAR